MEDLQRAEYPAMLANLHPNQAVHSLNDRVKRISKVNTEIADWLQERRKVEEQYVLALKRLTQFRVPNAQSELGTFQSQWDKILQSADAVAMSHHIFATKIEKDVEAPLRTFGQKKEMLNIQTIQSNLQNMARELEDAQERSEKLSKKGGKASAQKVDLAAGKLDSATQQWESQAPFIFESLQAVDESRMNQLRDCLTQYGTYEGELAQSHQAEAETVLNSLLDYNTANEIQHFVTKTTAGRPKIEKRATSSRQNSGFTGPTSSLAPPSIHPSADDRSDHSVSKEGPSENKLRSRIGTMLGRRRQSIHGGFGPLSPAKGPFGRNIKSAHGISPRASSSNLGDSTNRLGSLVEDPDTIDTPSRASRASEAREKSINDGTNGMGRDGPTDVVPPGTATSTTSHVNGTSLADIADVPPPPGPPPSQKEPEKDSEGFSVPAPANDPISQAQREAAAQEAEQLFRLNIQKEPVAEEDPEEKKAALSNVANSLSAMGAPARRMGTVRGRRDVRNTIYVPAPVSEGSMAETPIPFAPTLQTISSKPAGVATLASEASIAGTSDTQSIRSGNSLSSIVHVKHPDMHEPGLNSSIMETVSANFENGQVQAVKVNGEIAFSYNASDSSNLTSHIPIRINNFPALEVIGPNRIFVTNDTPDHSEQFNLDLSHIHKTSIGFSYRLHVEQETAAAEHVPVLLNPVWKPQGDKLGLLLQYKLNPTFKLASGGSSVLVHNLVLFASYEGKASGAQTKPSGTHLKDKHLVYWRLGDVTLSPDSDWQKIVCRIVGDQGVEPKPGTVEARWEVTPPSDAAESANVISVSRFEEGKGKEAELNEDDPFADESTTNTEEGKWVDVPAVRKLVSGKYEAR
ncbi:Muniscin C-terminal mu homology domain-containing protein [Annulohypoxylon maeteangense]|uniref:Muniscin C-terminal mu homology domain-containing protein n=1 Tax=Annulohypoxylon maeteangense TaxID=1927788 RepID=UPI0020084573|nr:Muniscin C-terminal mu homology domain-containing protein [Annulohypoxylon maeteangense]KAI0889150.1 Muniscin C-terminal mu homology domain-containing protein [Annulohypoxylon maeteangense]